MKHQELIERYIYAATRYMKKEEKEDVAKELRSIITDMLEERCGDEEPEEATVKAVLEELGDPRELYEKYSEDGKDCLIGAPYYGVYKYVLKTAVLCVIIGLIIAQMIVCVIDMPTIASITDIVDFIVNTLIETCATVFDGVVLTFAAVTLWFGMMYHKGIKMNMVFDSLEQLPQLPKKAAVISRKSIAFDIGLTVLFYAVFLACPEVLCMYDFESGIITPMFQTDYIHSTRFLIVAFGVLGIGRECMKMIEGTYSKRVLIAATIVDVISAVLAIIWLADSAIINPAFGEAMSRLFADESEALRPFVSLMVNFNYFFLVCIIFALIIDLAVVAWKYYKTQK